MEKTIKFSKLEIVDLYMNDVEKNEKLPRSIFVFCANNDIEETDFHHHFENLKTLEAFIFEVFYENTIKLLYADEAFNNFEAQDKVLSFYYTFFELLAANKKFVLICLESKNKFSKILLYKDLREQYLHFIESIDIDFIDIPIEQIEKTKDKIITNISWLKFILTIEYWLKDDSVAFEKTDVLIEKSVHTAFQLLNTKPLESVLDLGKFLVKDIFPQKK
ncbi:MAG: TetR family transcriptional regulator C-terminal domain-containing protein [Chitinophagales bacterium]